MSQNHSLLGLFSECHVLRRPFDILRRTLLLLLTLLFMLLADFICYQQTLPVEVDTQGGNTTLHVGSQTLLLGTLGTPQTLQFESHDPVVHEY